MSSYRSLILSLGLLAVLYPPALRAADEVETLAATIDREVAAGWTRDIKPAPLADDAEFFRRVHLDLTGRIPSVTEIQDFLDDDRPNKRRLWVERILQGDRDDTSYRTAYVNHFARVWRSWLLAQTNQAAQTEQPALEAWLRQRLRANAGYDQLVRDLLTQPNARNQGGGDPDASAAVFYQANELKPENLAGTTARLFLGIKLECAQCHAHPFDQWTRTQFWQYAAFFTDVVPGQPQRKTRRGEINIPGQQTIVQARFLDGKEPKWKDATTTRPTLADWLTAPDNAYFAQAGVNRLWTYFLGTGLVNPTDGTADPGLAGHQRLLKELARQFVAHHYDTKFLVSAILACQTYQRTSSVSHPSQMEPRLFARMPLRGLSSEQLFDSLAEATEYRDRGQGSDGLNFFAGVQPARAQFLAKFAAQEQKTAYQTSILQALYLMNNQFITDRTSLQTNRTLATLAEQRTSTSRKIESLYLVVLARKPTPQESQRFVKYVDQGGPARDAREALADVFWVLLNSPEFMLNH